MKNIYIGFIIGATSLIPGVSAGTILYISDEYTYIATLISNFKKNIKQLICLFLGILLGVLLFSKIIEYLFFNHYFQTMYFILCAIIINFFKTTIKFNRYNLFYIIIGILIIYFTSLLNIEKEIIITNYPTLTMPFLLLFAFYGFLDGFLTITPGISGSMIMMILGPYYLYKSYLANLTNNIIFSIPLLFYFIGDTIGLIIGSKFSLYLIKKHYVIFHNVIIGMIIASIIFLIPSFFNELTILSLILLSIMIFKLIQKLNYN